MDVQCDQARGSSDRVCVDPASIVADDQFGFLITDFKVLSNAGMHAWRTALGARY
jgi:hypothetical protein